jgi:hypothetical protein
MIHLEIRSEMIVPPPIPLPAVGLKLCLAAGLSKTAPAAFNGLDTSPAKAERSADDGEIMESQPA